MINYFQMIKTSYPEKPEDQYKYWSFFSENVHCIYSLFLQDRSVLQRSNIWSYK